MRTVIKWEPTMHITNIMEPRTLHITVSDYTTLYHILKLNPTRPVEFKIYDTFQNELLRIGFAACLRTREPAFDTREFFANKNQTATKKAWSCAAKVKQQYVCACVLYYIYGGFAIGCKELSSFSTARKRWPVSTRRSFAPRKVSEPPSSCANVVCNCKTELEIGRCDEVVAEDVEVLDSARGARFRLVD